MKKQMKWGSRNPHPITRYRRRVLVHRHGCRHRERWQ